MKKILIIFVSLLLITGCNKAEEKPKDVKEKKQKIVNKELKIINENSNSRPYAVIINNFPSATKVQSGLNKAYIVYEFPIEGGMSRSLALFKDVDDVKIGTIRSARQNYLDYVVENDAIFIHFGGNFKANEDMPSMEIDHIDGNAGGPFYRENPMGLASEHTAYTNLKNVIDYSTNTRGFRLTTEVKPPLHYLVDSVDLSKYDDSMTANMVSIPYSNYTYKVSFKYNTETKRYERYVNDQNHSDYFNNEIYDTKNIIAIKVDCGELTGHADAAGSNYLNINNIGSGKGYYITDGYAKEIKWIKNSRSEQTKYEYLDGSKVEINDGNTYIMFQPTSQSLKIE